MPLRLNSITSSLGIVLVVTILAACGSNSSKNAVPAKGFSGKSTSGMLTLATSVANARGSVHIVATESTGGMTGESVYDIARDHGKQIVSGGSQGNSTILIVSGVAYLQGDANFLQNSLGLSASSASTYAGRWIAFRSSDTGYRQVVRGDTLPSALTEATPTGSLTLTKATTADGVRVVGISGGLPAQATQAGATGSQVLYVSETSPHLPVEVVVHESQDAQSGTSIVAFSNWGEVVSVAAPSSSIPVSSISSAS